MIKREDIITLKSKKTGEIFDIVAKEIRGTAILDENEILYSVVKKYQVVSINNKPAVWPPKKIVYINKILNSKGEKIPIVTKITPKSIIAVINNLPANNPSLWNEDNSPKTSAIVSILGKEVSEKDVKTIWKKMRG